MQICFKYLVIFAEWSTYTVYQHIYIYIYIHHYTSYRIVFPCFSMFFQSKVINLDLHPLSGTHRCPSARSATLAKLQATALETQSFALALRPLKWPSKTGGFLLGSIIPCGTWNIISWTTNLWPTWGPSVFAFGKGMRIHEGIAPGTNFFGTAAAHVSAPRKLLAPKPRSIPWNMCSIWAPIPGAASRLCKSQTKPMLDSSGEQPPSIKNHEYHIYTLPIRTANCSCVSSCFLLYIFYLDIVWMSAVSPKGSPWNSLHIFGKCKANNARPCNRNFWNMVSSDGRWHLWTF